jgi:hypothetical protein
MRERRPGVFEIRIAVGVDPVSGRTVQRSFWFHGTAEEAGDRRGELAAQFAEYRSIRRAAQFLTIGELLERWLMAQHDWRPSTWSSARSNSKALSADPIAKCRVSTLRPDAVRVAMARWRESGATVSVVSGPTGLVMDNVANAVPATAAVLCTWSCRSGPVRIVTGGRYSSGATGQSMVGVEPVT